MKPAHGIITKKAYKQIMIPLISLQGVLRAGLVAIMDDFAMDFDSRLMMTCR